MFVEPDSEALIGALAAMLSGRILPAVDGTAAYYCQAALSMIARHQLARGPYQAELRAIAAGHPDPLDTIAAEHRLAARIEEDAAQAVARLSANTSTFLPMPDAGALARFAVARGRAGATVANVRQIVGGNSKQTIMFDLVDVDGAVEPLVMRRDHPN